MWDSCLWLSSWGSRSGEFTPRLLRPGDGQVEHALGDLGLPRPQPAVGVDVELAGVQVGDLGRVEYPVLHHLDAREPVGVDVYDTHPEPLLVAVLLEELEVGEACA